MQSPSGWLGALRACWVFPAAIAWKFGLILTCALPPPANDAFFFDGAVVNLLRHGAYVNPSIARVFPTSGTEVFCAYPPFYQAVLLPWMAVFGPTMRASLLLHGTLFAGFALLALAVLRRLGASAGAANLGGLFLFGLTFHDRPDSVAHVVGMLALWMWLMPLRGAMTLSRWGGAGLIVLTLATSLHIGAMYAAVLWMLSLLRRRREPWPWGPTLAMVMVPVGLVALVITRWPWAWRGFSENLIATPSFTGYRVPAIDEMLKVFRTAPAVILIAAIFVWQKWRPLGGPSSRETNPADECFIAVLIAAVFTLGATLFVVAPNYVNVAGYSQVLVVGLFATRHLTRLPRARFAVWACAGLVSIRALGLSTWGVACAVDVSPREAMARVQRAVRGLPEHAEVLASSAYLYDLAGQDRVACLHTDWVGTFGEGAGAFRPACLVLTPYDYYRRYQRTLADLAARGRVTITSIDQQVRVPPPDSFPSLQRVLQHVSWAPVIVHVEWH